MIPAFASKEVSASTVTAAASENTGLSQKRERSRVLIIEDEKLVALDIKRQVERFGYEVCGIAVTAGEAVVLNQQYSPDLILMDVRLSGGP